MGWVETWRCTWEPLAVEKVSTGEIDRDQGSAESLDRLEIDLLGHHAFGQERLRAGCDPESPVCAASPGHGDKTTVYVRGEFGRASSGGGLDQLGHVPVGGSEVLWMFGNPGCGRAGLFVAPEAVAQHRLGPLEH